VQPRGSDGRAKLPASRSPGGAAGRASSPASCGLGESFFWIFLQKLFAKYLSKRFMFVDKKFSKKKFNKSF
jgi:hypothetical protein